MNNRGAFWGAIVRLERQCVRIFSAGQLVKMFSPQALNLLENMGRLTLVSKD
ncbi:MAG: hypothetical protein ACJAX9_000452 [Celeribacter sp.]